MIRERIKEGKTMNKFYFFCLTLALLCSSLFYGCATTPWFSGTMVYASSGTMVYASNDMLYARYRSGMIKRHIASNGRYLEYVWLRSKDLVDYGGTVWTGAKLVPSVNANERVSAAWEGYALNTWVPVIYSEQLSRSVPSGYSELGFLGYVATEPGPDRIPLYEWVHNTEHESAGAYFVDHYYSTNPESPVARHRYRQTGIIGYLSKNGSPGFVSLYVGFNTLERNHILTTDKSNPLGLRNFQWLGYIKGPSQPVPPYDAMFKQYGKESPESVVETDNFYSAIIEKTYIIADPGEEIPRDIFELASWIREHTVTTLKHFQTRQVIAGGGDNPLYEGGLALATFSLEHIHEVSPHSLEYAKKLFEFIELSEELKYDVLEDLELLQGSGYLRRTRNHWADANSWGASTEELIGVLLGLKYFIKAVPSSSEYYARARSLVSRIAFYLNTHWWIYADSRLSIDVENYAELAEDENVMVTNGLGPILFQYPFGRVFKGITGNSYKIPFEDFVEKTEVLEPALGGAIEFLVSIYPVAAGLIEFAASFTQYDDFVFSLGTRRVDTHGEVYELVIANAEPLFRHFEKDFKFWNLTMLLYTGIMVLDPNAINSGALEASRARDFAKWYIRFIKDMMLIYDESEALGFNFSSGTASENVLFAVIAQRCFELLSGDEVLEAFEDGSRTYYRRKLRDELKDEIDLVIKRNGMTPWGGSSHWQKGLPLGEPERQFGESLADYAASGYPWTLGSIPPVYSINLGIGHNHAWRYPDAKFYFYSRNNQLKQGKNAIEKAFDRVGPYYRDDSGKWSLKETLKNLRRFARVGYKLDEPLGNRLLAHGSNLFFKMEAGGNDLMFMRMLLAEFGIMPAPVIPDREVAYETLPIPGSTPWVDTQQRPAQ